MKFNRRQLLASLGLGAAISAGGLPRRVRASQSTWPSPIRPGDRLIGVAPGTWVDPDTLQGDRGWSRLYQDWGFNLVIPGQSLGQWAYFSGTDQDRASLLRQAWRDPGAQGVVCIAGGWGAARSLEAGFDPGSQPRWCVGFSDNCALLLAQLAAGGRGGIHGWKDDRVRQLLIGEEVSPLTGRSLREGVAEGELVVTNLTVATHLIGTPWMPSLDGAILVLEDVGEAPYRVDRMLTHWRTAGLLQNLAGIGLGHFRWKPDDVLPGDLSLEQVLEDRLGDLGIPIIQGLPVGHGRPNKALPLGRRARLDAQSGTLSVLS
jgi:muramoyltetrapeptide carboxypeptidase